MKIVRESSNLIKEHTEFSLEQLITLLEFTFGNNYLKFVELFYQQCLGMSRFGHV